MENILRTKINICDLEQGMTVEHNGKLVTVSRNDIKFNELFGYSFRGDGSIQTVTRIQFIVKTAFGDNIRY